MVNKIAFLDRDGVINEKAPEHDYIKSWEDFHFKSGAIEGIRILNENAFKVVIVTNQRGIARGLMTENVLKYIHKRMVEKLQLYHAFVDAIFYCPHENGTCNCRKPAIGMFLEAERKFPIDKEQSFMIGDTISDIEAGNKYGIKSYLLQEGESLKEMVLKIIALKDKEQDDII